MSTAESQKPSPKSISSSVLLILIAAQIAIFTGFSPISAAQDFFWHCKIGEDWVAHGLSPFVDQYGVVLRGQHVKYVTWIFDALIFFVYHYGWGFWGVSFFRTLIWFTTDLILLRLFRRLQLSTATQIVGVVLSGWAFAIRPAPRPELLAFLLGAWALDLYFKTINETERDPSLWPKRMLWFSFLIAGWSLYHVSSILAYVLAAALFVKWLTRLAPNWRARRNFALAVLVCFAAGFCNVDFRHPLFLIFEFAAPWSRYVQEYLPFFDVPFPLGHWLIVGPVALCLCFQIWRKQWWHALVILILLGQTLKSIRLLAFLIFLGLPIYLISFQALADALNAKFLKAKASRWLTATLAGLAFFSMTAILFTSSSSRFRLFQPDYEMELYPQDVANYMKEQKYRGVLLTPYGIGGYFLFQISPDVRLYVDGRTNTLYSFDFIDRAEQASHSLTLFEQNYVFAQMLDRFTPNSVDFIADVLSPELLIDRGIESEKFDLDYADANYGLLRRGHGQFKLTGRRMVHPECLRDHDLPQLEEEHARAIAVLPHKFSAVGVFQELAIDYLKHKNKFSLLHQPAVQFRPRHHLDRLMVQIAARENHFDLAKAYYEHLPEANWAAKLTMADLLCRVAKCEHAEALLASIQFEEPNDYAHYQGWMILKEISKQRTLKIYTTNKFAQVRDRAEAIVAKLKAPPLNHYCIE